MADEVDGIDDDSDVAHLQETIRHLLAALETRTTIGIAIGLLMAESKINAEQAFDVLRRASQRQNRKLREVADEIAATHNQRAGRG